MTGVQTCALPISQRRREVLVRVIAGEHERLVADHARACVDGVGARATLSEGTVGKYLEWGTWEEPVASEVMRVDLAGSGRYEVYYYDLETGVIIRIVGPGETRCWLDRFLAGVQHDQTLSISGSRKACPPIGNATSC